MPQQKKILVLIGSASANSSNHKLVDVLATLTQAEFELVVFPDLKNLPHFDPELSSNNPPESIVNFRDEIARAKGVLISTPEYIFSIPSGLKNALEWCVATTVFAEKPLGIITASADGRKGHEELQLIMKTLMATFNPASTWLIQGVKGKIDAEGHIKDNKTQSELRQFIEAFRTLVQQNS